MQRQLLFAATLAAAVLLGGCDKGQSNSQPASPAQTAAPAPSAPMTANTEANQPATAPLHIMPGGNATTLPTEPR